MSQAIPTPEQPEGPRNRWRKPRVEQVESAQVEPAQDNVPPPAQPAPVPPAAPQLTEAQEIAQRIAAASASEGETLFAALSREQRTDVLIAAGELGLSTRAFSNAQKNLYPLLNVGDAEKGTAPLQDADFFRIYANRKVRLRPPFEGELDWDSAAIRAVAAGQLTVAVRRDGAGGFHRYPLMMPTRDTALLAKAGGVAEVEIEAAVLGALVLGAYGVKVNEVQP